MKGRLRMNQLGSVLDFLLMMRGAISKHGHLIIPRLTRVFQYEDNHHKLDQLTEILKSNCTRVHQEGQDLYCSVNAGKQIQLLIDDPDAVAAATGDAVLDIVAVDADVLAKGIYTGIRFQQANKLFFLPNGSQLSSLTKEVYDSEVIAHRITSWASIYCSIEDSAPLLEYITNLNLNIAHASMDGVCTLQEQGW